MTLMKIDNSKEITKLNDYLDEIKKWKRSEDMVIYRGQYNINWPLIPKIARPFLPISVSKHNISIKLFHKERKINNDFYLRLPMFGYGLPVTESELYQLIIGQHHGLPTRLLDFTTNPLAALFFALTEVDKKRMKPKPNYHAIWCIKYDSVKISDFNVILSEQLTDINTSIFYPPHIDNRIFSQQALFIFCRHPSIPLEEQYLFFYKGGHSYISPDLDLFKSGPSDPRLRNILKAHKIIITKKANIKSVDYRHLEIIENRKIIARIERLPRHIGQEIYLFNEEYRINKPFFKLVVPNNSKIRKSLLDELDEIGINNETLFPDLDGISKYLSQKY